MSRYIATGLSVFCRSVVCLSVTFVDCGQTAIDRLMISSLSDRAKHLATRGINSIEIGSSRL